MECSSRRLGSNHPWTAPTSRDVAEGGAQRNVSAAHPKSSAAGPVQRVPQDRWRQRQRINPDTAREMAQCTVVRLEKAL